MALEDNQKPKPKNPLEQTSDEDYDPWASNQEEGDEGQSSGRSRRGDDDEEEEEPEEEDEQEAGEEEEGGKEGEAGEDAEAGGAEGVEGAEAGEAGAAAAEGAEAAELAETAAVAGEGAEAAAAASAAGPVLAGCGVVLAVIIVIVIFVIIIGAFLGNEVKPIDSVAFVKGTYAAPFDPSYYYTEDDTPHTHHNYSAFDVPTPSGTPVFAITSGVIGLVCQTDKNNSKGGDDGCNSAGTTIRLAGDDGVNYQYEHLIYGSPLVNEGDQVSSGQQLALTGNTGRSFGAHLHFEITCGDPEKIPGGCTKIGERFPQPARCGGNDFDVVATNSWKFMEAVLTNKAIGAETSPWARYGHCPHQPPGDDQ